MAQTFSERGIGAGLLSVLIGVVKAIKKEKKEKGSQGVGLDSSKAERSS